MVTHPDRQPHRCGSERQPAATGWR